MSSGAAVLFPAIPSRYLTITWAHTVTRLDSNREMSRVIFLMYAGRANYFLFGSAAHVISITPWRRQQCPYNSNITLKEWTSKKYPRDRQVRAMNRHSLQQRKFQFFTEWLNFWFSPVDIKYMESIHKFASSFDSITLYNFYCVCDRRVSPQRRLASGCTAVAFIWSCFRANLPSCCVRLGNPEFTNQNFILWEVI